MMRRTWILAITCAAVFLWVGDAAAQAVLKPPFGLRWGDPPEKLIEWAEKHNLNITITLPGNQDGLSLLRISSNEGFLPNHKASALEGRFLGGRLFEMTVDYVDPKASAEQMKQRFNELKRQITREQGELRANQQQRVVADQFVTRTQSFHREPFKGLFLLLAYTEVEDLLRKSKAGRFSLIYRNDNFRQKLEEHLTEP